MSDRPLISLGDPSVAVCEGDICEVPVAAGESPENADNASPEVVPAD
jgi:hypothetical protein